MADEWAGSAYAVPRYEAPPGASFYHVLHGHVPGHQIDFIYAPEVRRGELTPTHFSHLARLMKYVEPQPGARYAFAIANLSRDDTQFVPGHGALGLFLGMRIEGAIDHTGRKDPPFAHAIAGVDREFSRESLAEAGLTLSRHVIGASRHDNATVQFYQRYVECSAETPELVSDVLASYIAELDDLPTVARSRLPWAFRVAEDASAGGVTIVYDDEPFAEIVEAAAKIAAVLYRSNIRWTQVSTGGERDLPGGVTVRFVMRRNAPADARHMLELSELPSDEIAIAAELFGAIPVAEEVKEQALGWREKFAYQAPTDRDTPFGPNPRLSMPEAPDAGDRGAWSPVAEAITRVAPLQSIEEGASVRVTPASVRPPAGEPSRVYPSDPPQSLPARTSMVASVEGRRSSVPHFAESRSNRSSAPAFDVTPEVYPPPPSESPHASDVLAPRSGVDPYQQKSSRRILWGAAGALCVTAVIALLLAGGSAAEPEVPAEKQGTGVVEAPNATQSPPLQPAPATSAAASASATTESVAATAPAPPKAPPAAPRRPVPSPAPSAEKSAAPKSVSKGPSPKSSPPSVFGGAIDMGTGGT